MIRFNRRTSSIKRTSKRGAAAVEFAVIAPLLFTLIFTMMEASRYLMGIHATTGAAREATRLFAVTGDTVSAEALAVDYLRQSSFNVDEVTASFVVTDSNIPGMQNFSSVIEVKYEDVSLLGGPFSFGVSSVQGYAAMMLPAPNN